MPTIKRPSPQIPQPQANEVRTTSTTAPSALNHRTEVDNPFEKASARTLGAAIPHQGLGAARGGQIHQLAFMDIEPNSIKDDNIGAERARLEDGQVTSSSDHFEITASSIKGTDAEMQGKHLGITFKDLSQTDFQALQKHYGGESATFEAGKEYTLKDFLPPHMQALHLTRFASKLHENAIELSAGDEEMSNYMPVYPDITSGENNCFGIAMELSRKASHPDTSLYSYNLERYDAAGLYSQHFDTADTLSLEDFAKNGSAKLQPGDTVVLYDISDTPQHASTYIGSPKLSDGSQAQGGDLFMEKRDSSAQDPVYVTDRKGVMTGYIDRHEGSEWTVKILRQKTDNPVKEEPIYKSKAHLNDNGTSIPENVRELSLEGMGGRTAGVTFYEMKELPLAQDKNGHAMLAPEVYDGSYLKTPTAPPSFTTRPNRTVGKQIQQALVDQGANIGVDGQLGRNTKKAIKEFQSQQNLPATGQLNQQTWNKLFGME